MRAELWWDELSFGTFMAQEQYPPQSLLQYAYEAEKAGFDWIWTSDHFHPWFHSNASSGFAWVWIASALERIHRVKIGTGVTAPYFRYHPAIVAQAFATLDNMYPGRVFLGVGMGEAMNEVPLGFDWPATDERIRRFEEAIKIIKALWEGNFVDFNGHYFKLRSAKLYTLPTSKIPLIIASNNHSVTFLAGRYADGWLTIYNRHRLDFIKNKLFKALEEGARIEGRDPNRIKKCVHIVLSYDEDEDRALKACKKWAASTVRQIFSSNIYDPRELERIAMMQTDDQLKENFLISSDTDTFVRIAIECVKMGFTHINFSSISPNQSNFIKVFGEKVIPQIKDGVGV